MLYLFGDFPIMPIPDLWLSVMSKDYRFRKEESDGLDKQDSMEGKQREVSKVEQTKAELIRKKRASKLMAETRSKQSDDSESAQ
ncbi:MAG: hypothetical protein QMA97_05245 [Glaciecola sp.]